MHVILCSNDQERGRILDMSRRLRPVALASIVMLLTGAAVTIPTFGWAGLIPDVVGAVAYYLLTRHLDRFRRPELALLVMWLAAELLLGLSVVLAHGPRQYLLALMAFPAVFGSIMFPRRVVVPGVAFTLAVTLGATLGYVWHDVSVTPPIALVPVVIVIVLSMTGAALSRLDATSRSTAIVDQLTGVFNRMALIPRAAELAHQAATTGKAVSVIVGDVDAFKSINDQLGHIAGDAVLKEVALRLGACLGPFEPIYRFGGEEFVIMLAGVELAQAAVVAETLRQGVSATPIRGSTVTMSFGVAASSPEHPFEFDEVFARADGALYAAKRGGRNRVTVEAVGRRVPDAAQPEHERRRRRGLRIEAHQGTLIQLAPPASGPWRERIQREHEATGNWLVRDQVERDHMLDLNRLLGRNFRRTAVITFAAIIAAVPWFGPLLLVPPAIGGAAYNLIQLRLRRLRRPEFALVTGWLLMQLGIAGGFALSHHSPLFALTLFLLMVIGSAAVFPRRAVVLAVAATALLIVATALVLGAHQVRGTPGIVIFPLVMVGIVGLTGSAVGRSSIHYRGAAVVDELTGMLNRGALAARAAELAHQSLLTREPVALILADLDRFKSVNDGHGHSRGDAVLQEVAYRIRKHMRAFDSVYRIGGEEFAVLLAGADAGEATSAAERIWDAVRSAPVDGLPVTISCGVCATTPGEAFDFDAAFARADAALYVAKRSGRDAVQVDSVAIQPLAA
jgi:diguanylate cyclase (GGDEF)-like protein